MNASECSCTACVNNCRRPAHFMPDEIKLVEEKVRLPYMDFTESKLVAKLGDLEIMGRVPKTMTDGWCIFFNRATKLCNIHEVKPFGCKYADHTTTLEEGKQLRDMLGKAWLEKEIR